MIKQHFKHSWQIIRQNKLYSGVYILGTALAIAMVMAYAIIWYVRVADIYPEVNRDRSLYMGYLAELSEDIGCRSSSMSEKFIEAVVPGELRGKEIEAVAVFNKYDCDEDVAVYSQNVREGIPAAFFYATPDICKVFGYKFLYGAPFTEADVTAKTGKAFITRSYARKLFGCDNAVGMSFTLNFNEYTVCGVIKDVSRITSTAYANIWLPLSADPDYYAGEEFGDTGFLGLYKAIILARSASDFPKIKEGISSNIKRLNSSMQRIRLETYGQPDNHFQSLFRTYSNSFPDIPAAQIARIILIFLALLFVPAVNLAGIIASGMENRLEELGIRKAFGASGQVLLRQIIRENLLLTFMGGVLGLFISFFIILNASGWLLKIVSVSAYDIPVGAEDFIITPSMLFNPEIFILTFFVCLILNMLAAVVPAYISLRKNIVDSLTANKK